MSRFQNARTRKTYVRSHAGRMKAGILYPVHAEAIRPSEGGMLSQQITCELDPVMGRLLTPITLALLSVFMPTESLDALKNDATPYSGITDVVREKLLSGAPLFDLETEGELSKRMGIIPISISGTKRVCEIAPLAYNVGVNFLRRRVHPDAVQLPKTNRALTPALIRETATQRFRAVLQPENRVNGAVKLQLPTLKLPVRIDNPATPSNTALSVEVNGAAPTRTVEVYDPATGSVSLNALYAGLDGVAAGNVSLDDFYRAEQMDKLTRQMRKLKDDNPEWGDELVLRWVAGLTVEGLQQPVLLARREVTFGTDVAMALDSAGVQAETLRTDLALRTSMEVPIPTTELGGVVVTFAMIKPDETFGDQPHPIFSQPWGVDNFVADELATDPVPVTVRDLDVMATAANEANVMFYTAKNELKRAYTQYGFNRQLNQTTVAGKFAVWQYKVPLGVTPTNVLYPASISQAPFADTTAEVCFYQINTVWSSASPMVVGPTPVEELAVIETADVFKDA